MTETIEPVELAPVSRRADQRMRRVYRRRRVVVFGTAGLVIAVLVYLVLAAVMPLRAATFTATDAARVVVPAAVQPVWPKTGEAAVGIDGQEKPLVSRGGQASVPIASITKIVTALSVLRKKPIAVGQSGPEIRFTKRDEQILEQVHAQLGSWAPVKADEVLTEKQALTAMLLPSANNYAISLAVWAYGSKAAYLAETNAWLKKLGLAHTRITDPSGLDSGTVSSTGDLLKIGRMALDDPVLASIVSLKKATLPTVGEVKNGNRLLGTNGITGLKTGFTYKAGHNLLFSATAKVLGKTRTLVGVVLGQKTYDDLWSTVPKLLKSVEAGFRSVDPGDGGATVFGTLTTPWGARTQLVAAGGTTVDVWSSTRIRVSVTLGGLRWGDAGADAGTATFTAPGSTATAKLVTTGALPAPDYGWRLTHPQFWL